MIRPQILQETDVAPHGEPPVPVRKPTEVVSIST